MQKFFLPILSILIIMLVCAAIVGIIIAIVTASKRGKSAQTTQAALPSSYFDGGTFAYLGMSLLAWLISVVTLGIGLPWAECMLLRWETKHTVIDGRRLVFDGTGGQLFVRYILWWFLSLITFGIYSFWATVNVLKWETEHTYAEGTGDRCSFFDGKGGGYLGYKILFTLMTTFSLGIAYPWAVKMMLVWTKEHTVVSSRRFCYTGKGSQLLGHYLLWTLLSIITFGIYGLFVPVRVMKLIVGNTHCSQMMPQNPTGYAPSYAPAGYPQGSYQDIIKNDATRYTLAETNRQLKLMRLGLTEDTPFDTLYPMVQQNIPEAQYVLAMQMKIKDEDGKEEQIRDLLKKSADAGFAPAQYEYSDTLVSDPARVNDAVVEESIGYFMKSAEDGFLPAEEQWMHFCLETGMEETSKFRNADDTLQLGVYWHDIVVERGGKISDEDTMLYNTAVDILRMKGIYCGKPPYGSNVGYAPPYAGGYAAPAPAYASPQKNSNVGKIVAIVIACVIGGYLLVAAVTAIVVPLLINKYENHENTSASENYVNLLGTWEVSHSEDNCDRAFYQFRENGTYNYYAVSRDYRSGALNEVYEYSESGTYTTKYDRIRLTDYSGDIDYLYYVNFDTETISLTYENDINPPQQQKYGSSEQSHVSEFVFVSSSVSGDFDIGNVSAAEVPDNNEQQSYDNNEQQSYGLSTDDAMNILQGKWYCHCANDDFNDFTFEGNNIKKGVYYTERIYEDDMSWNNIYDNGIFYIVGGGMRSGYFDITQIDETGFRLDITYPADAQYGEEMYETLVIHIDTNNYECFFMTNDDGVTTDTYSRGNVEDLRIYG